MKIGLTVVKPKDEDLCFHCQIVDDAVKIAQHAFYVYAAEKMPPKEQIQRLAEDFYEDKLGEL